MKKQLLIIGITLLLISVAFSGCTNTPLDSRNGGNSGPPSVSSWVGWSKHSDKHGFSVCIPQDWSIDVNNNGLICIGENPTQSTGEAVFIWTMVLNEQKTEEGLFDEIVALLETFIPELQVTSERHVSEYGAYVGTIEYEDYIGVLILSINGSDAYLSGLAAHKDQYNESLDNLIRVLYSFNYEPELMDPDVVGIVQMETWTDPNEGAFTINVPKGWTISSDSGITRPYLDAAVKIVASKDDMGISIEQLHPPLYYTPSWVLDLSGYYEGSWYAGGLVLSYHNARQYVENRLPSEFGFGTPLYITDRSDILQNVYSAPWVVEKTAVETSFNENGITYNFMVGDEYYELAGVGMWAVSMIYYWAPEEDLELVAKIANEMMLSFELDGNWAQNEQQQVALRTGLINAVGDDIANIIKSTFEYRDYVMDQTAEKWSNAILGIEDVYDLETGEHWTVPSGSNHYWSDIYGDVYSTGSYTPPTYSDDWKELYCPNC